MNDNSERIAAMLEAIGQIEGSLLYRAVDRWRALKPGELGQVLAIGYDGMPGWYDPDNLPNGGSILEAEGFE